MQGFHGYGLPLAFALALLVGTGAEAQTINVVSQKPKTKLEAFEALTSTVVLKGYQAIGSVPGDGSVAVECIELTDTSTGKRQTGLVIEVKGSGKAEAERRVYIDFDEIGPLVQGIDRIFKVTAASTKLANFEASYRTKGDFKVTTFGSADKVEASVKTGSYGGSAARFSTSKLADLRALIAEAKQRLDSSE